MPISGKFGSILTSPITSPSSFALPSVVVHWVYNPTPAPARLQVNTSGIGPSAVNNIYTLQHTGTSYTFNTNKNYQFITNTVNLYAVSASFSVTTPWNDELKYYSGMTSSGTSPGSYTQSYIHYSSPPTVLSTTNQVTYKANGTFSSQGVANEGITGFSINEIDFRPQGFSYYRLNDANMLKPATTNSLGWYYDKNSDMYHWYDRITGSPSSLSQANSAGYFPVGGQNNSKVSNIGYRLNNCLIKFVPYSYFNFSFSYQNQSDFPLRIYTSYSPPSYSPSQWSDLVAGTYIPPANSILLATLTQSVSSSGATSLTSSISHTFYGVRGNQYLFFVGGFAGASASSTMSSTYSSIYLTNIKVDGGYHSGNNRQYLMTTGATYSTTVTGLTGATYAALVGNGNTINATASLYNPGINKIYSKIGNGKFTSGVWENGVWNSGWRVDEGVSEFYNVYQFFSYNKDKRWRLQITGPTSSVANFNIGDNVSIGNIVAIDINEDRKLLKGYYTIINKTSDTIIVEFDNNFPIRRIKRDSDNHRIYVTKNVWLSGGFLNGYFKGIWNYGLFKGYPLITEMYDTHWIDGIFDGGHFSTSQYTVPNFTDTVFQSGSVGLTFSEPHGLVVGDLITIDKDDKTINSQYDGDHYVTGVVNNYQIITDIDWGSDTTAETGSITIDMSKGVLQKVKFKSNNISKVTSNNSMESDAVFVYNSWMDVLYDSSYASNIGKNQMLLNNLSRKSYSENNLYGYTTYDVLESESTFRDSYSTTIRNYKLGTKYKIFSDFIGDAGKFENEFGGSQSDAESTFIREGWTFSRWDIASLTFSRTQDSGDESIIGEELRVEAVGSGGILDISPFSDEDILNRTYEEVQRFRYTKVEFDLITYSSILSNNQSFSFFGNNYNIHSPYSFKYKGANLDNTLQAPPIHFNNLNFVNRKFNVGGVQSTLLYNATYLPIFENVNHLTTPKKRKAEFFYNKRNLAMHFYGYNPFTDYTSTSIITNGNITIEYVIDNLHFYEVDMIPFFQYFTEDNINKGIQIPYQGISPFIDYTNSNFSFVDNISIGLDSIQTQNSNTVVSGVGAGVGQASSGISGDIYMDVAMDTSGIASAG